MPYRIVRIVEGQGDVAAVPVLLRRLIAEINPPAAIDIAPPIRQSKGTLLKAGGVEAAVQLAVIETGPSGAVLILIDSDGDCPEDHAPVIAERSAAVRNDKKISVVLAHHKYEAWFLAAASSLRGVRRLSMDITDHEDPESVSGCKEWLGRWLPEAARYSETADQAALTSAFDMEVARRGSPSFDKLWREVDAILQHAIATLEA